MIDLSGIIDRLDSAGCLVSAPSAHSIRITGVADDSRSVGSGTLFCAVQGTTSDGHTFLDAAAHAGAAAALVTHPSEAPIPQIVVNDDRRAAALAAAEFFGRPAEAMELFGVTGTNGKSTTVAVLRHLLNANRDVGVIGTIGALDGEGDAIYREGLTTPGPVGLQRTLAELRRRGVRRIAIEVSSHALDQRRVEGVTFQVGVFTNLSHDHLDYHASFDAYRTAKLRLAEYVTPGGALVINADDPAWTSLMPAREQRVIAFGRRSTAAVRASSCQLDRSGTSLTLHLGEEQRPVTIPLVGDFNVMNCLGAAGAAWAVGLTADVISRRLATAPQVPGRMERLATQPSLILRDYAHTPDALRRALAAARALTDRRLIVLFGCGGDRDRQKRAPMGQIAVRHADVAIVTSDNPRTENPDRIIDDIVGDLGGHAYVRITDRREAIARAVDLLQDGDCLLLAGKGHETYQVIGTERLPFDEATIVAELLTQRASP